MQGMPATAGGPVVDAKCKTWKPVCAGGHLVSTGKPATAGGPSHQQSENRKPVNAGGRRIDERKPDHAGDLMRITEEVNGSRSQPEAMKHSHGKPGSAGGPG